MANSEKLQAANAAVASPLGKLQVKLLSSDAIAPKRATSGAAGYDLYSAVETEIAPGATVSIATDITVIVPTGTYGRIAGRSGLAVKWQIGVLAGVIDSDYRGLVFVLLINHGKNVFKVSKGERIAQLILEKIVTPDVTIIETVTETVRGEKGFGSTGK